MFPPPQAMSILGLPSSTILPVQSTAIISAKGLEVSLRFLFQRTVVSIVGYGTPPTRGGTLAERASVGISLGVADGVRTLEFKLPAQSRIALPRTAG
jgi:hypothetical protein